MAEKKSSLRIYLLAVVLFCIVAGLIFRVLSWTPVDSETQKASEAVIRRLAAEQLNKDPNDLTDEDFTKFTHLILSSKQELNDIKLLEKFVNLQKLTIAYMVIPKRDLPQWMTVLGKFGVFDLDERASLDLSPLKKLKKFRHLELYETQISSLNSLRKLKHVKMLTIFSTKVSDLKIINGMKNLRELIISHCPVSDIGPVTGLKNLEQLDIIKTQISDFEPLKKLKKLKYLRLQETKITDLEAVRALKNMERLLLINDTISDLEPLKGLTNLKQLQILNCENITNQEIEDLQKSLPDLKITR